MNRSVIKAFLGRKLYATPIPAFYFRNKFVVTAFHRINSSTLGDGLTCSPENFRAICTWLAENFNVTRFADQIRALEEGRIIPRSASITFDDGYLDNFEVAMPILLELGLPATFFVSTSYIGSRKVTPWDEEKGINTEWMTWDHVQVLLKHGFDVESHTCTHLDLGTSSPESARKELLDSLAVLHGVGAAKEQLFAYPFGGRSNITDATRAIAMESGFRVCASCYGGVNGPKTNPAFVVRFPVNEEFQSPDELGLELMRSAVAGR